MRAKRVGSLVPLVLLLGSCYSPGAPSASYLCDESRPSCPDNLQCICGSCVAGPEAAACALKFSVPSAGCPFGGLEATLCVTEGQRFPVSIQAFSDRAATRPSTYSGTARFESTWGHARPAKPFTFTNGRADIELTLDRATPNQRVYITARAGSAAGASPTPILVDPPPYDVEPLPTIGAPFGWAQAAVALPAIDPQKTPDGKRRMYFSGVARLGDLLTLGIATSDDGDHWTPDPAPLFMPDMTSGGYFSPSILRETDGTTHLFFNNVKAPNAVYMATSMDGGKTFGAVSTAISADCRGCGTAGIELPWTIVSPTESDEWLLYFTTGNNGENRREVAVARTVDRGKLWTYNSVPTPRGPTIFGQDPVVASARVLYDGTTGVYRMWFAVLPSIFSGCELEVAYATSEDGEFWTGAREGTSVLRAQNVPWIANDMNFQGAGIVPADVQMPDPSSPSPRYTLWFSMYYKVPVVGFCLPLQIGRAHPTPPPPLPR